jgi:biotin synthase-related radical SAM superfamily protein
MHRSFLESLNVQKENQEYLQISMAKTREVEYSKKNFIRVEWPKVALDKIMDRTEKSSCNRPFGDSYLTGLKSYPFKPERRDMERIRKQLFGYEMDIINPNGCRYQ